MRRRSYRSCLGDATRGRFDVDPTVSGPVPCRPMGSRAICVSRDPGRTSGRRARPRAPRRSRATHHDALPSEISDVALLVVDRETRESPARPSERGRAGRRGGRQPGRRRAVRPDDGGAGVPPASAIRRLVSWASPSEKLVSKDLFGLEKYLAPGTAVGDREVHDEPPSAPRSPEICSWAEGAGARRPLIHRIASVADELLMNAMIDAPRESQPTLSFDPHAPLHRALLRWAPTPASSRSPSTIGSVRSASATSSSTSAGRAPIAAARTSATPAPVSASTSCSRTSAR